MAAVAAQPVDVRRRTGPAAGQALPDLLEIPVTTMPGVRTPIHMSYVLYLAQRSELVALRYSFATALRLCELRRHRAVFPAPSAGFSSPATPARRCGFSGDEHGGDAQARAVRPALPHHVGPPLRRCAAGEHARRLQQSGKLARKQPDLAQ